MVQKIITAFRAKHKFNLSNERLQLQADKWAKNIENEEDIENFIESVDVDHLIEIARLDDALRTKPKTEDPKQKDDEPTENPLQAIMDEIKSLKTELAENKSQNVVKTRSERLKNIPQELQSIIKHVKLDSYTDDEFNSLHADLTAQAETLELNKSKVNPKFSGVKTEGKLSADEKRYLESKQKK